jgi:hypothetical protein
VGREDIEPIAVARVGDPEMLFAERDKVPVPIRRDRIGTRPGEPPLEQARSRGLIVLCERGDSNSHGLSATGS